MKTFIVVKRFLSGVLAGIEVADTISIEFIEGKVYKSCTGNSEYIVVSCKLVEK